MKNVLLAMCVILGAAGVVFGAGFLALAHFVDRAVPGEMRERASGHASHVEPAPPPEPEQLAETVALNGPLAKEMTHEGMTDDASNGDRKISAPGPVIRQQFLSHPPALDSGRVGEPASRRTGDGRRFQKRRSAESPTRPRAMNRRYLSPLRRQARRLSLHPKFFV